jgi:hypothetical protein
MKKLLLFLLIGMPIARASDSAKSLNNFRDNLAKAAEAPFVTLPYYGLMSSFYFGKKPYDPVIVSWNNQQAPQQYQSESSKRSNQLILTEMRRKLEKRNTPMRIGLDTALSATGLGLSSIFFQYTFKKCLENSYSLTDLSLVNVAVFAGIGGLFSLGTHASLSCMSNQAASIARAKNR